MDVSKIDRKRGKRVNHNANEEERINMNFKENLKSKRKLDRLLKKLLAKTREPPEREWTDLPLLRELLDQTDFQSKKVRTLDLFVRPLDGTIKEILVHDMGLPVYHTTEADVALRKNSYWQEIFDLRNIKKIMFDRDVLISKGKASLKRLHAVAVSLLDLSYNEDDLALLMDDVHQNLQKKSLIALRESFDLIFYLLGFQEISLGLSIYEFEFFAKIILNDDGEPIYENLILFDEDKRSLGLKKGFFSPRNDLDLKWLDLYARGKQSADFKDSKVFEFLSNLAQDQIANNKVIL
jgi:hypothetical protein